MEKKNLYFVGVYLKERIHFDPLGFTNYAFGFTEAGSPEEAGEFVRHHFTNKLKADVVSTRAQIADPKFAAPVEVIKPPKQKKQQTIFDVLSIEENGQTTFFQAPEQPAERVGDPVKLRQRFTANFTRLFGKLNFRGLVSN